MNDQDLPIIKHFPDDYTWIDLDIQDGDKQPYLVKIYTAEDILFIFYYKTIEDAELAFKMMCMGV